MSAKRITSLAAIAESIAASCTEIEDAYCDYIDPDGETAAEKREARDDAATRIEDQVAELLFEAKKMQEIPG